MVRTYDIFTTIIFEPVALIGVPKCTGYETDWDRTRLMKTSANQIKAKIKYKPLTSFTNPRNKDIM